MDIEIGKGLKVNIELTRLGFNGQLEAAAAHIVKIGARNVLMDSHASVKREDYPEGDDGTAAWREDSLAIAMKKLDALYKGEVRANATTRASSVDPVEAEALRMARVFVGKATRGWEDNKGDSRAWVNSAAKAMELQPIDWTKDGFADSVKAVLAAAIKRRASRPDVREAAAKAVEAAKAVNVAGEDLGL